MGVREIKTSTTDPDYTQRTILDGVEYILAFRWNGRAAKWFFSLYDQSGDPIVEGVKVVADFPLLRPVSDTRKPPGDLIALDTTGEGRDPGLGELGDRVILTYLDSTED